MILPAALLVLSPLLVVAFVTLDRLIRTEYESERSAWESDGRPRGYFWRPPVKASWLAFNRVAFVWLFRTPAWANDNLEAPRLLRRLRICVAAWNVGVLIAFVVQMASAGIEP